MQIYELINTCTRRTFSYLHHQPRLVAKPFFKDVRAPLRQNMNQSIFIMKLSANNTLKEKTVKKEQFSSYHQQEVIEETRSKQSNIERSQKLLGYATREELYGLASCKLGNRCSINFVLLHLGAQQPCNFALQYVVCMIIKDCSVTF